MNAPLLDQFADVLIVAGQLVARIRDDQWTAATPCTEWDVRQVLNHLVAGNHLFAEVLDGTPPAIEEIRRRIGVDVLGDDPGRAWQDSADRLLAAFRRPGALEMTVSVPAGTVPGVVALHLRITEVLVHAWDLARATGLEVRFDDGVVLQEVAFSRQKLTDLPPGRTPFAPAQPVPDDAAALDRLAALLGRPVG